MSYGRYCGPQKLSKDEISMSSFPKPDNCIEVFLFEELNHRVLLDFSLTVKAATLIFISGRGSANSFAK